MVHPQNTANSAGAPLGAFATAALELRRAGLCPIPTGGNDGKSTIPKWPNRLYSEETIAKMAARWPEAGVGILTKVSGVTVVDIDDPALVPAMLERFGDTPLKTTTPRGGVHLWYRSSGEGCKTKLDGLDVDLKGLGGKGGMAMVPPSARPDDGRAYSFLSGTWADVARLPAIKPGALQGAPRRDEDPKTPSLRAIETGRRNKVLHQLLLREAPHCDSEADLTDVAETIAGCMDEPLPAAEIAKTVRSAWSMETEGRNWVGRKSRVILYPDDLDKLTPHPDALALYCVLRRSHDARPTPFAIAIRAMRKADTMSGMGWRRLTNARDRLLTLGLIECIHQGGHHAGDESLYRFKGTKTVPYIKVHPSPLPVRARSERDETDGRAA